jgi:hypothetical protein
VEEKEELNCENHILTKFLGELAVSEFYGRHQMSSTPQKEN